MARLGPTPLMALAILVAMPLRPLLPRVMTTLPVAPAPSLNSNRVGGVWMPSEIVNVSPLPRLSALVAWMRPVAAVRFWRVPQPELHVPQARVLPSSQVSPVLTRPSPHTAVHVDVVAPEHVKPVSTVQVALQPSPPVLSASSQASPAATLRNPSPQSGALQRSAVGADVPLQVASLA